VEVLVDYFRNPPAGASKLTSAADEHQFRKLLAPRRGDLSDFRVWNETVHKHFPQWHWPSLHLGSIAVARKQWAAAARELEPIAGASGTARLLLAYVRAKQQRSGDARKLLEQSPGAKSSATRNRLQAHVHRMTGNFAAAVRCFEQAGPLRGDDLLCFAESLINERRFDDARGVLDRFEERDDPRWLLLAGCCAPSSEEALRLLARCFGDNACSAAAVTRALLILERDPGAARPEHDKALLSAFSADHAGLAPAIARVLVRHAHRELARGRRAARKALKLADSLLATLPDLAARSDVRFARACLLVAVADVAEPQTLAACDEALTALHADDPRVRRIAAARQAISGNYREALRLLPSAEPSMQRDALQHFCGEPTSSPYYAAVDAARLGAYERALQSLERVTGPRPLTDACTRLHSWIHLQQARQLAAGGERAAAANCIAVGARPADSLGSFAPRLLPWLISEDARPAIRLVLAQTNAQPALCHQRGIFHLCETEAHATRDEWDEAIAEWELAIGCLTVAISDPAYLAEWIDQRAGVYLADGIDADAVSRGVIARISESIGRWQKVLAERDEHATAAAVSRLALALQAEVRAAALIESQKHLPAAMGPLAIRCFSLERRFADLLAEIRRRRRGDVDTFERAFSDFRYAALLEQDGQTQAALDELRAIGDCPPSSPAFEDDAQGRRRRKEAARKLEMSLLLRLGEEDISSSADHIDGGIARWREALELSSNGTREATIARIRETAIGRAQTLDERDRYDEAIRLLEGVNTLCGDEAIRGQLATVHAQAAIQAVNEQDDWQRGVDGLRTARELNRRSPFIDRNLVIALRQRGRQIFEDDRQESAAHLQEALSIAEVNLRSDRDNSEWQEMVQGLRSELMFLAFSGVDTTRRPPRPPMLTTGLSSGRGSAHRERALAYLADGRFGEAATEFQNALRLDPNDHQSREQLAGTLMRMLGA
jgi:tetratricopeptide (TPR) repeat protein